MTEKKTGIFYRKDPAGVVVMLEGEAVFEYKTVEDFIRTHVRPSRIPPSTTDRHAPAGHARVSACSRGIGGASLARSALSPSRHPDQLRPPPVRLLSRARRRSWG